MNKPHITEPGLVPAATEDEAREQLAALYRLYVHFGWTDLIYTHASARGARGTGKLPDQARTNSYSTR